jgi:hypothetical protein
MGPGVRRDNGSGQASCDTPTRTGQGCARVHRAFSAACAAANRAIGTRYGLADT